MTRTYLDGTSRIMSRSLRCPCGSPLEVPAGSNARVAHCNRCGQTTSLLVEPDDQNDVNVWFGRSKRPAARSLRCPCCNRVDRVETLEAAHLAGQSRSEHVGLMGFMTFDGREVDPGVGLVGLQGESIDAVSEQLAPPEEPKVPGANPLPVIGFAVGFLPAYALAVVALLMPLKLLGPFRLGGGEVSPEAAARIATLILAAATAIGLALFVGGLWALARQATAKLAPYQKWFPLAHARWEYQVGLWSSLYYCRRDHTVFDPTTGESTNAAGLHRFLYEASERAIPTLDDVPGDDD